MKTKNKNPYSLTVCSGNKIFVSTAATSSINCDRLSPSPSELRIEQNLTLAAANPGQKESNNHYNWICLKKENENLSFQFEAFRNGIHEFDLECRRDGLNWVQEDEREPFGRSYRY